MYRLAISMFLCLTGAVAAPQDLADNSNVTFVQPLPTEQTVQLITDYNNTLIESRIEKLPLTIPGIAVDFSQANDVTTEIDTFETTTSEKVRAETTSQKSTFPTTEKVIAPKKPSFIKEKPKFVSKLSYFNKASVFDGVAAKNLVERTGKRKFKSRCRCEKIWNCPKLQITVPRCPDEYFLCCF